VAWALNSSWLSNRLIYRCFRRVMLVQGIVVALTVLGSKCVLTLLSNDDS